MKRKFFAFLFTFVFALAASCSQNGGGSQNAGGTLVLRLTMVQDPNTLTRTLLPDIDMTPAAYTVTGTGPGGATFSESTATDTLEVNGLAFGDWNITAEANNADSILIGRGTGTATVHTGSTAYADITVTPIEGYGTLNLTVNWTAGDIDIPSISAQLLPYSGSAMALDFTLGTGTATYSNTAVPTGYYTLIVKLLDNGIAVMGAVEVVRIVNEGITSGSYDFFDINSPGGSLIVNIDPEMNDPLTVTMTGQVAELPQNQSMTVTASVAESVGNITYVWYINGDAVGTGNTYTASGLAIGVYRLDVTAFTVDGKRAGSATSSFIVVESVVKNTWQKCLGGTSSDVAYSIQLTSDSGYIVAGETSSNDGDVSGNHGTIDFWIVKLNNAGDIQWQKCLGGSGGDYAQSIQQTSDSGYIVAGCTTSNDGDVSGYHGGGDFWVVKLNNVGDIQWQKCIGGSGFDSVCSIQQTSDSGYIVAGDTSSNDGNVSGNHGSNDSWIVKLSSEGYIQWQKCLGGSNQDEARSIRQASDGGYIIAGCTNSNDGDVNGNHGSSDDVWVVKLSSEGDLLWQKCLGGTSSDVAYSIQLTSDSGYIVAGETSSNDGDVSGNHGRPDVWVVKLSSDGALQWQKCLGGSADDYAYSIRQTSDGGYIVAGYTGSDDGDVSGNHGSYDSWIVKLSSEGYIQWQKCLGGNNYDYASSIQQISDSGYIVAGYTNSNDGDVSGNHGEGDAWVVKLDSNGNL